MWRAVIAVPFCALTVEGLILHGPAAEPIPSFESFVQLQGRSYAAGSAEYGHRRAHYERRAAEAELQNSRRNRRWTAGVNEFWDWSEEELATLRGYRRGARSASGNGLATGTHALGLLQSGDWEAPTSREWKNLTATTHIARQGGCGSCWAIATTTTLQAHTELHTGVVRSFSPQELVSCVPNPQHCGGEGGCKGATVEMAMEWIMQNGLSKEDEVPYRARDLKCAKAPMKMVLSSTGNVQRTNFGMSGWEKLPENKYEPLMHALTEKGPVAVSASANGWASYSHGVFDGCPADAIIDHAIVAIGFGVDGGNKYWIIQNSWGQGWGENGYMRLLRRDDDASQCGIDRKPEMGTGCIGGPKEVTVCGMCGILYDSVIPHFN